MGMLVEGGGVGEDEPIPMIVISGFRLLKLLWVLILIGKVFLINDVDVDDSRCGGGGIEWLAQTIYIFRKVQNIW